MAKRFVGISLSDNRMDMDSGCFSGDPINKLPVRCQKCDFPDLDFVSQPYFLLRGDSMTPAEISAAAHGNLLVRPRLRRIIEAVLPKQCRFYPTAYFKSSEQTPWSLAVPVDFCHAIQFDDEESQAVDGVMFASTGHGDCFVFDVRKDRKEYEVFVYLHEMNSYENYAPNFVRCLKRFVAAREAGRKPTSK